MPLFCWKIVAIFIASAALIDQPPYLNIYYIYVQFFQALFILLGFVCMLSLEYVARTHRPHHGPSSPPASNWTCSLKRWEPEWDPPPVNLTCVKGELTLAGRQ